MRHVGPIALGLIVLGCNHAAPASGFDSGDSRPAEPSSTSSTNSTTSTSTGSADSTSTSTATSSTSADGSTSADPLPDFGGAAPLGCQGKIDIIFSISTSNLMAPYQERLVAAFPSFIDTITTELGEFDPHILIAPHPHWSMPDCSLCQSADCDPAGAPPLCGASLDACDTTWGAGRTFPAGVGASNRRCELPGGRRYLTAEDDLTASFPCLAQVGQTGTEAAFDVILAAVGEGIESYPTLSGGVDYDTTVDLNAPGACNAGFLRDDALLLVVIIQNQFEQASNKSSFGLPWMWARGLYDAKGGDEDAVVALAITTDRDIAPNLCAPGEPASPTENRMRTFMETWLKHGHIASICAPSYGEFFAEVAAEIGPLCDSFIPQ